MKRQTKIEQSEMETPSKRKSPRKEFSENDKSKQKSPQKSPQVDHSKAAKINPKSSTPKKGTKKKKQSDPVAEQQQASPPVITPLSSPIKPSGNDNSLVTGVITNVNGDFIIKNIIHRSFSHKLYRQLFCFKIVCF